ncbi:MAG: response regulator transcription factor [Lachnospiraceae bacterium]|jgi:Response regulator containing a CheY-like receiver domain and an HTH DNA-binding domain|nr:response regulator transcription factor [Lachnospiraceae bacterium]
MLEVLLVDDEPLLLESLEIILSMNQIKVIGMAHDGKEALAILREKQCQMALVDLNMKGMGGIELIKEIKKGFPWIKILVLTTFYDDKNITNAIAGGADGYLLKGGGKDAILAAVEGIMGGQNVIGHEVMERLAVLLQKNKNIAEANEDLLADMTEREKEICTLLAKGLNNRQIADELYISEGTVKNYISSIYDKTGIHDRSKLIVAMKE